MLLRNDRNSTLVDGKIIVEGWIDKDPTFTPKWMLPERLRQPILIRCRWAIGIKRQEIAILGRRSGVDLESVRTPCVSLVTGLHDLDTPQHVVFRIDTIQADHNIANV